MTSRYRGQSVNTLPTFSHEICFGMIFMYERYYFLWGFFNLNILWNRNSIFSMKSAYSVRKNARWDWSEFWINLTALCENFLSRHYRLITSYVTNEERESVNTANTTWVDFFESSKLKAWTSLLPLFSPQCLRAFSFELWNRIRQCHPKGIGCSIANFNHELRVGSCQHKKTQPHLSNGVFAGHRSQWAWRRSGATHCVPERLQEGVSGIAAVLGGWATQVHRRDASTLRLVVVNSLTVIVTCSAEVELFLPAAGKWYSLFSVKTRVSWKNSSE